MQTPPGEVQGEEEPGHAKDDPAALAVGARLLLALGPELRQGVGEVEEGEEDDDDGPDVEEGAGVVEDVVGLPRVVLVERGRDIDDELEYFQKLGSGGRWR